MKITTSQLRQIIKEEIQRRDIEDNDFEEFVQYAQEKGIDPQTDEAKSLVGDFCDQHGLDPHAFYGGLLSYMGMTETIRRQVRKIMIERMK